MVEDSAVPARQRGESAASYALRVLDAVPDPEVPVLSVRDLGIVRDVVERDGGIEVVLTPTYCGCPATQAIAQAVQHALEAASFSPVRVSTRLGPAWTSDWISEEGRRKLRDYGIVPPAQEATVELRPRIACPQCGSKRTETLSSFGATACKSLHRCLDCREPFEHFKTI